jgi:hypothetical protein
MSFDINFRGARGAGGRVRSRVFEAASNYFSCPYIIF